MTRRPMNTFRAAALGGVLLSIQMPAIAHADTAGRVAGLEADVAGWRDRYCETGGLPGNAYQGSEYCQVPDAPRHAKPTAVSVADGRAALRFDHEGGARYSNVMYQYRLLDHPDAPTASVYSLQLAFLVQSTAGAGMAAVQAIEFAMDRWITDGTHNDVELQWSNYPSTRTAAPHWSVFAGNGATNDTQWIDTGVDAPLAPGSWHTLALKAHATPAGTAYDDFLVDGAHHVLGQSFPRVPSGGNEVTIHVQLDGAAQPVPYEVLVRDVSLSWGNSSVDGGNAPTVVPTPSPIPQIPPASGGTLTIDRARSWCAGDCSAMNFGPLVEANGYVNPRGLKFTNDRCPIVELPALASADYWDGSQVHMAVTGPAHLPRVCVASFRWFG